MDVGVVSSPVDKISLGLDPRTHITQKEKWGRAAFVLTVWNLHYFPNITVATAYSLWNTVQPRTV